MKFSAKILHFGGVIYLIFIYISIVSTISLAQNFINNGANITIKKGAYVIISDIFKQNNSNIGGGAINSNGTMIVQGDWENYALNHVFSVSGGEVILNGNNPQNISGNNYTSFENLTLRNSEKTLTVDNTTVKGKNTLDAVLNLNKNRLIIDNPNTDGITYISKYILSETLPNDGYGEVQWNIGNTSNNKYEIPFGTGKSNYNDLNLTLSTSSQGQPSTGYFTFATFPSDCNNNPFPLGVTNLGKPAEYIADRYWIIDPNYSILNPDVNIIFTYTATDIDQSCNPEIKPELLKGETYCTTCGNDWKAVGIPTSNPPGKTVRVNNVKGDQCYAPWRLVNDIPEPTLYIPNAFTPGLDGLNDKFGPIGEKMELLKNYKFYIFNRWGVKVFETSDINTRWDGIVLNTGQEAPEGLYVWMFEYMETSGQLVNRTGNVTLLRNGK